MLIRSSSLTPGVNYQFHEGVDIKGISKAVMRTEGTVELKLFTETHETTHTFHVLGEDSEMHCDAIFGKDFLEERDSVINYCSRQLVMNEVIVNFDPKPREIKTEPSTRTLKARTGNIVSVPTTFKGVGLLPKNEILPGVYIAASPNAGLKRRLYYQYNKNDGDRPDCFTPLGPAGGIRRKRKCIDANTLSCSRQGW